MKQIGKQQYNQNKRTQRMGLHRNTLLAAVSLGLILLLEPQLCTAQQSLSLKDCIHTVVSKHPSVEQAEERIRAAQARIDGAKSGYYPTVDAVVSYTRLAPLSSIAFGPENFQLYPANNYNAAIEAKEVLYDFGRTSSKVDAEQQNVELTKATANNVKQQLASQCVHVYLTLRYLNEAIAIKDAELKNLHEHLDVVTKRQSTGSGTSYEVLATNVKISNTESQKTDLVANRANQLAALNVLLGEDVATEHALSDEEVLAVNDAAVDSLIHLAYAQRNEVYVQQQRTRAAELNYASLRKTDNPTLSAFFNGGLKNGLFPDMFRMMANYAAGFNLQIPLFDGYRKESQLHAAEAEVSIDKLESDNLQRTISSDVVQAMSARTAALQKHKQFQRQLEQASQAYSMATTNFNVGAITNMELLDAQTNVAEAKLLLLRSDIDRIAAEYTLRVALGTKLYE